MERGHRVSSPIPLRDFVVGGLVSLDTVNALLAFGEPMLTEDQSEGSSRRWYRAWIRLRSGGRTFGRWDFSVQFAAEDLLGKLRARP
jgi:hypothetical protein